MTLKKLIAIYQNRKPIFSYIDWWLFQKNRISEYKNFINNLENWSKTRKYDPFRIEREKVKEIENCINAYKTAKKKGFLSRYQIKRHNQEFDINS